MRDFLFSIIIPSINTSIVNLIDSLEKQSFPKKDFEVIIIKDSDNPMSFSNTALNIRALNIDITNPSLMRNLGIDQSKGSILAFIDDDAEAFEDWLFKASSIFKDLSDLAILAGPAMISIEAPFREKLSYEMAHAKFFGNGHDNLSSDTASPGKLIGHINSCNLFIKKDALLKIKAKFNTALGYGGEDTLLIQQFLKAKYKILYSCDVKVCHRRRKFGMALLKQKFIYRINNGLMLWVKPSIYLNNPKFSIGFIGISLFLIFSFLNTRIFLSGMFLYFLISYALALSYLKKSVLMFLVLPVALFMQHIVYYAGILFGIASIFSLSGLKRIKQLKETIK